MTQARRCGGRRIQFYCRQAFRRQSRIGDGMAPRSRRRDFSAQVPANSDRFGERSAGGDGVVARDRATGRLCGAVLEADAVVARRARGALGRRRGNQISGSFIRASTRRRSMRRRSLSTARRRPSRTLQQRFGATVGDPGDSQGDQQPADIFFLNYTAINSSIRNAIRTVPRRPSATRLSASEDACRSATGLPFRKPDSAAGSSAR